MNNLKEYISLNERISSMDDYILEKLSFKKGMNVSGVDSVWAEEAPNYMDMPNDFFDNRKLKNKKIGDELKNRPWYAVYIYLTKVGKAKAQEIRENVFPGKSAQQAELFCGLREHGIIETVKSGPDRGYYIPKEYSNWVIPSWVHYPLF